MCPRSESGLEQICFCDGIHTCLSPDSDMSMSKRNMHHVWTRSDKGKILRCSDLVSKFLLDRFPLTKISKRLRGRSIQGSKNSFDQFFLQTRRKNKLLKKYSSGQICNLTTNGLTLGISVFLFYFCTGDLF